MAPEELRDEECDADRDHDPGHEAQDLVGPLLQLGADQSELPCVSLEAPRIGHLTHCGRSYPPGTGDHKASREHRFAGGLGHRLRLTGEEGLVDFETLRCQHLAVDRHLVAPTYLDHIVQHDLLERDVEDPTRADDVAPWCGQHSQPIECPLRADLLEDPDRRIGHEDDAEERILRRPNHHSHDEQGSQDGVEASEHVGPHDLTDRAPGGRLHTVGLAGTNPLSDLPLGEPDGRVEQRFPLTRGRGCGRRHDRLGRTHQRGGGTLVADGRSLLLERYSAAPC